MKSIKLSLAVLALAVAFTACTKEEVSLPQDNQSGEYVGAKLLGTNISANFEYVGDSQTKVDANGNWTKGDKLGLAWVIEGSDANAGQANNATLVNSNNIYANHMFITEDAVNFFTYGNVYEGWHFGYYPFKYMPKPGQPFKIEINPTQTQDFDLDKYVSRKYVTKPLFLTELDNLDDNNQLYNVEEYKNWYKIVKTLGISLKMNESILKNTELNTKKIKSVTLSSGSGKIFFSGVKQFNPVAMFANYGEEGYNLNANLDNAWDKGDGETSIKTVVANDDINLGADQMVRIFTLPVKDKTPQPKNMTLIVEVEDGSFEVPFVLETIEVDGVQKPNPLCTDIDKANNETFRKLVRAFYVTDKDETPYLASFANHPGVPYLGLNFELTADKFTPNKKIHSEDEWNNAVALVNTLNLPSTEFEIVGNWSFKGDVNLPTMPLTVKGNDMVLEGTTNWPNVQKDAKNPFVVNTNVVVKSALNVAGLMKVETGKAIVNKSTINAGAAAKIKNLNNTGRVIVEFGAEVEATNGTIAYVVADSEQATIAKINTLIYKEESNPNPSNVNTLIVKTDLALDAVADPGKAPDAYGNKVDATLLSKLDGITIELNGGSLIGKASAKNVKEVIAVSGTTSINGIVLANHKLTINGGELTATNVEFCGNDVINVAEGAVLNIENTTAHKYNTAKELNVSGTANVNLKGLTVADLVVNGTVKVADYGKVLWTDNYNNTPVQGLVARGAKNLGDIQSFAAYQAQNSVIYMAGNLSVSNYDVISASTSSKNITLNLNGNTLSTTGVGQVASNLKVEEGTISTVFYIGSNSTKPTVKFADVIFTGNSTGTNPEGTVQVASGDVTISGCTFNNTTGRGLVVETGFDGDLTVSECTFKAGAKTPYMNPLTGKVKLLNNKAKFIGVEFVGVEDNYIIEGNEFEAIEFYNQGSTVKLELSSKTKNFISYLKANNAGVSVRGTYSPWGANDYIAY